MALLEIIGIKSITQAVTVMKNSWCLFGLAGQMKMPSEDQWTSSRFSGDYEKYPSSTIHYQRVWANKLDNDRYGMANPCQQALFARAQWSRVSVSISARSSCGAWNQVRHRENKMEVFRVVTAFRCLFNQGHTRCIRVCSSTRLATSAGRQKMACEMIQNNLPGPLQTEVQGEEELAWHVLRFRM